MGDKEMARRAICLLREECGSESRLGKGLLEWVNGNRDWLWPERDWSAGKRKKTIGWAVLPSLTAEIADDASVDDASILARAIADLLSLEGFDQVLLETGVALHRVTRLVSLRRMLEDNGADIPVILGRIAGADAGAAAHAVRASLPFSLGLFEINQVAGGGLDVDTSWTFDKVLNRGIADSDRLAEAMVGTRQAASLGLGDFAGVAEADLLVRLLRGALDSAEPGINILIHGPPGTGKTELARTLAAAAGAELFAVGEQDDDGDEPTRFDRIHALKRAQRVLERRGKAVLLFDEMEDLIGETRQGGAGYAQGRMGSKIFVNRMLEANRVPVLWTSNAIDLVDSAHLRRMSFVLKLDHPGRTDRARILARIADGEAMAAAAETVSALAEHAPELASVARVALRSARIAGGAVDDARVVVKSLVMGLRHGEARMSSKTAGQLDLALYESDPPVA